MANETRGILFETIAEVALRKAVAIAGIAGEVRWNEKPEGMSIVPDFTIGVDNTCLSHVVLVTASGSSSDSHKKFGRNLAEMYEIKSQLAGSVSVLNLYFMSEIKQGIDEITQKLYDATFHVQEKTYYSELEEWVKTYLKVTTKTKEEKQFLLSQSMNSNPKLAESVESLAQDLATALGQKNQELEPLWILMREDYVKPHYPPTAKTTTLRRGLGKLLVLEPILRQMVYAGYTKTTGIPSQHLPEYVFDLGFFTKTLGGGKLTDDEMKGVIDLLGAEACEAVLQKAPDSMNTWIEPIRNLGNIIVFADCVSNNYNNLKTSDGMMAFIQAQHLDPFYKLDQSRITGQLQSAWIFDFVGSLEKAKSQKSQAFGFAYFSQHSSSNREQIGNMDIGTWCSCFMNQYFNRQPDFTPPLQAIRYVSAILSEKLREFPLKAITEFTSLLRDVYMNTNLEKKLIPYRNFEPLLWLLETELDKQSKPYAKKIPYEGWVNEYANVGKRSATTPFVKVGTTLIHWKSSYASHPNDKTKELSARARSIKYQYHPTTKTFSRRQGVDRLALIVDGDWKDNHLQTLANSGWDIIVYPDEIANLVSRL